MYVHWHYKQLLYLVRGDSLVSVQRSRFALNLTQLMTKLSKHNMGFLCQFFFCFVWFEIVPTVLVELRIGGCSCQPAVRTPMLSCLLYVIGSTNKMPDNGAGIMTALSWYTPTYYWKSERLFGKLDTSANCQQEVIHSVFCHYSGKNAFPSLVSHNH